jgi:hypothetical protein
MAVNLGSVTGRARQTVVVRVLAVSRLERDGRDGRASLDAAVDVRRRPLPPARAPARSGPASDERHTTERPARNSG